MTKNRLIINVCMILHICILLTAFKSNAQFTKDNPYFLPNFNPQSPNAASLGKYGTYPVNYYTGIPDISIPLYEIEAGGIKVPVTLSYHASGNKVSAFASWAGLGWSLEAGGQITRTIMGANADEASGGGYLQGKLKSATQVDPTTTAGQDYLLKVESGYYDTEPDIFSYSFPGKSGKFFFDGTNNYTPVLLPYAPVKINKALDSYRKLSFSLLDDKGTYYSFGKTYAELSDFSNAGVQTSSYNVWPLETIISQNRRDTVSFSYTQQSTKSSEDASERCVVEDQIYNSTSPPTYYSSVGQYYTSTNQGRSNMSLLSHINYRNNRIDFNLSSGDRADNLAGTKSLDNINILRYNYATKSYQVLKTIKFYTSYFAGGGAALRLDSLDIKDMAGATVQRYKFVYDNSVNLPAHTSYGKDYWGYYNGKDSQTHLIPQQNITDYQNAQGSPTTTITIGSNFANGRDPDPAFMQANILKTIYYPTGGHTDFTYETNSYQDNLNNIKYAGGLRVSTIKSYDGISGTPIVKTYKYGVNESGYGRQNFNLKFYYFNTGQTYNYWTCPPPLNAPIQVATKRLRTYLSNPSIIPTPYDGILVTYATVTEYIGDGTTNIGKTIYQFNDRLDAALAASISKPVVNSYFYARGQLLSKSIYNNSGTLVQQENNNYSAFAEKVYSSVGFVADKLTVNESGDLGCFADSPQAADPFSAQFDSGNWHFSNYGISSDDNYLVSTTTNTYDTTDPTKYASSTVSYTYSDTTYQQVAKTTHTNSKGNTLVTVNKYPFNYLAGSTTGNPVLDTMLNRHMYGIPIEKRDSIYYPATSAGAIVAAELDLYKPGYIPFTVVSSAISVLNIPAPVTDFTQSKVLSGNISADARYVQMISFDQYDTQNNIAQYTPRNATPVSVLWDYLGELPVAQVKNATYSYAGNTQAAYTSFEAQRNGGWYYSGTPVYDGTAPTGKMVYPLSSGSVSSPAFDNTISYTLSLWSNNGAPTVYAGSYLTATSFRTTNGWTYYEYPVPSGAGTITISGSTSIDELRLYPSSAQMTTYAYDPSGVTAITDTKGAVNYFEYDYFTRLKNVKDWNGNIIKNYGYHTFDQTAGNDPQSGTFTRNNCPAGTNPQSTTFSVPANKYLSSSKSSANTDAMYDLNTNGQLKANNPAICGCPVQNISFLLSNSTGLSNFQASFSGPASLRFNFPANGNTTVQVPAGTYTVAINAADPMTSHNITLGSRPTVTAPGYTFYNVVIGAGSTDSSITIN